MTRQTDTQKDMIKQRVMEYVRKSAQHLTPLDLERRVSSDLGLCRKTARKIVKSLVSENRLSYTQNLGRSFVEISRNRPVNVGQDFVLAPPGVSCPMEGGRVIVRIAAGASFGIGDHATTRIALKLISRAFRQSALPCLPENAVVLDIGTGSGVLAIAACLMGAGRAVGTDTDPCARSEASHNVCLNALEERICINYTEQGSKSLPRVRPPGFSLILANLRYPTLAGLHEEITRIASPGAIVIFSGFRDHEIKDLVQVYASCGFRRICELTENDWCGITLKKEAE
ncbi:MAG: 50S ribosomal protein L11 methyltransferase [Desulfobacterales bacterium]